MSELLSPLATAELESTLTGEGRTCRILVVESRALVGTGVVSCVLLGTGVVSCPLVDT